MSDNKNIATVETADQMKQNRLDAIEAERTTAFTGISEEQMAVLLAFDLYDKRHEICADAFTQALRNKCRTAENQAILAKDKAFRKGQKAVTEAMESEYQKAHALFIKL